jgi:hypothetical protein
MRERAWDGMRMGEGVGRDEDEKEDEDEKDGRKMTRAGKGARKERYAQPEGGVELRIGDR